MTESSAQSALRRMLDEPRVTGDPWRAENREAFLASGLPSTRLEDWRFTPLAKLEKLELEKAPEAGERVDIDAALARVDAPNRLVFVNGRLSPNHSRIESLPGESQIGSISARLREQPSLLLPILSLARDAKRRPFLALNNALFEDGAFISIGEGVGLEQPIHLVFVATSAPRPYVTHVRNAIGVGRNARARIVEHHVGAGAGCVANAVTTLGLEASAQLDYTLVQELGASDLGFLHVVSAQERESRLALRSLALGGSLARVEIDSRLSGEGAGLELDGLYLGRGTQHQDHHTTIDHAAPRTMSHELFKGILDGRAHGVFHGRVHVRPHAQKIDASQTNRALLLSDGAVIDSKPQLEIYADDVKCSHGASVGQLDPDQLFYLRARGLDEARARALLTYAFASEVLEKLPVPTLRESLEHQLLGWLGSES